jgi:hypothetical protein
MPVAFGTKVFSVKKILGYKQKFCNEERPVSVFYRMCLEFQTAGCFFFIMKVSQSLLRLEKVGPYWNNYKIIPFFINFMIMTERNLKEATVSWSDSIESIQKSSLWRKDFLNISIVSLAIDK